MPENALRRFLAEQLPREPVNGLVVGLSGGLDSRVLLRALSHVAPVFALPLRAVHVHHGLSPNADAWATRVAGFCAADGVTLEVRRVRVGEGASLENAARVARHAAFAALLRPDEALLLAQHRDDQAETVLFRLLRGAGVTGLGAMRAGSRTGVAGGAGVPCWRPFLGLPRAALLAYARAQGLEWVEDESNADPGLDRNYLRHEILPRLAARWPAVSRTLADTALRLQEADDLLQALASDLAASCIDADGRLAVAALAAMAPSRQRLLVRHWLQRQGYRLPDAGVIAAILDNVVPARPDAMPRVSWPGGEVRRYRDHLHVLPLLVPPPPDWAGDWAPASPLLLPDGRRLLLEGSGAPPGPWRVRFRRGGERLRPAPGRPSRELRTWLQEQGVPPWVREHLPLVFAADELIAMAGLDWPGPERTWRVCVQQPGAALDPEVEAGPP